MKLIYNVDGFLHNSLPFSDEIRSVVIQLGPNPNDRLKKNLIKITKNKFDLLCFTY